MNKIDLVIEEAKSLVLSTKSKKQLSEVKKINYIKCVLIVIFENYRKSWIMQKQLKSINWIWKYKIINELIDFDKRKT